METKIIIDRMTFTFSNDGEILDVMIIFKVLPEPIREIVVGWHYNIEYFEFTTSMVKRNDLKEIEKLLEGKSILEFAKKVVDQSVIKMISK